MSTVLKVTSIGRLIEQDTVFDERFTCPCCKKESVKITYISVPSPKGFWTEESECEDCGETFSTSY